MDALTNQVREAYRQDHVVPSNILEAEPLFNCF